MNVLVFLFDYGAIEISKDVADIIMKLLRDGMYTCLYLFIVT